MPTGSSDAYIGGRSTIQAPKWSIRILAMKRLLPRAQKLSEIHSPDPNNTNTDSHSVDLVVLTSAGSS